MTGSDARVPLNLWGVLEPLSTWGEIVWAKGSGGRHPLNGLWQPSYVVWRYSDPRDEARRFIRRTLGEDPGTALWEFDDAHRNWVIAPRRVLRATDPDGSWHPGSVMDNQDFCASANAEFFDVMGRLRAPHE
jgi:hypothetical protein